MGRRAVPELPGEQNNEMTDLPVFGSEEEANAAPGGKPASYAIRESHVPMQSNAVSPFNTIKTEHSKPVATMSGIAPRAQVQHVPAPPPKSYRVVGIPMEGKIYITASGRTARMVPNKVLDERYFDIPFLRRQGFDLTEITERKIGVVE